MNRQRLTISDRVNIQAGIAKGYSLAQIAAITKKSRSTIMREIIRNSRIFCSNRWSKKTLNYDCSKWKKFPYTCNGCECCSRCRRAKRYYDCNFANDLSKKKKTESRQHIEISKNDFEYINSEVSKRVLLGQSLHHIYVTDIRLQNICSERTIRRYIYKGLLIVKAHNLPRYVRYLKQYKPRKTQNILKVGRLFGRTFENYEEYIGENPGINIFQLDSVIGKISDKKAILTITYPKFRFQFGVLIEKGRPNSVNAAIRKLQLIFGDKFKDIFSVFLADNGTEFANLPEIEADENGEIICRCFYTHTYCSTDKAECERNHEFIRYIIPKHKTLDNLNQEDVNKIFSHINSYVRKSNENKTPFELMQKRFGSNFLKIIGIVYVKASDVQLNSSLIK